MKNNYFIFLSYLLIIIFKICEGSNILFYFSVSTYSHRVAVWPFVEALSDKGHNVTFLSWIPPLNQNPNIIEFSPKSFTNHNYTITNESPLQLRLKGKRSIIWDNIHQLAKKICEITVTDHEILNWMKNSKFDLIIFDGFFNECGFALAHLNQAKYIVYSPTSFLMWYSDQFGHFSESSWIPELDLQMSNEMTFLERVYNTFRPIYWYFNIIQWDYFPEIEKILKDNLNIPNMPNLMEMWKNTSLVFLNTHYSFEYARTLPPLYISVGGLHITNYTSELSKELSDFIDESGEDGFMYFSMGSVAKASTFPSELLKIFYDVFENFKTTRFVWVFDNVRPKEMPANVFTVKWAPQQAILSHKNIKGFISQAGAMSTQEAIYFGVPTILFPLFGDQDNMAGAFERNGCGIKLEIIDLQRETLRKAISNILTDESYKLKITQVSKLYKDRPMKPVETAVWWTEYILRNNDVSNLKPLSINQTWYEIRLLDVWFFIFSCILIVLLAIIFSIRICFMKLNRRSMYKLKKS